MTVTVKCPVSALGCLVQAGVPDDSPGEDVVVLHGCCQNADQPGAAELVAVDSETAVHEPCKAPAADSVHHGHSVAGAMVGQ